MVTFQVEPYAICSREIDELLQAHFDEVAIDQTEVPLCKDEAAYQRLAASGELHILTCRCDGKLIGYCAGFIRRGLHNAGTLIAYTDVFYVHPDHRKGRTGVQLFIEFEKSLKARGVRKVLTATKTHLDMSRIFERLGWTRQEIVFSKVI